MSFFGAQKHAQCTTWFAQEKISADVITETGMRSAPKLPVALITDHALEDLAICRSALNAALIAIVVGEQPVHLCLEHDPRTPVTGPGNLPSFP